MTQEEVAIIMNTTQKVIHTRLKEVDYKCRIAAKRDQKGDKNHMWKGSAPFPSCIVVFDKNIEKKRVIFREYEDGHEKKEQVSNM